MPQDTAKKRDSHIWEKHPDNWYVEPAWCAVRLFECLGFAGDIHDPCCGMAVIPDAAVNAGYVVTMSDIEDRGASTWWGPAFTKMRYQDDDRMHDNIVTNPPFDDVNQEPWPFLEWALAHAVHSVALLVPFKWFGGDKRSRYLERQPLAAIYVMTPRPSMPPGPALLDMIARGEKPEGGREDFAWAIFSPSSRKTPGMRPIVRWIHRDG